MKTNFTFLLICLTTSFIFAQAPILGTNPTSAEVKKHLQKVLPSNKKINNSYKGNPLKQLDSLVVNFKGNDPYYDNGDLRIEYEYDIANNPTKESRFSQEDSISPWVLDSENNYFYDNNNNRIETTYYSYWQGAIDYGIRHLYTYNSNNLALENEVSDFDTGSQSWNLAYKELYTYDAAGKMIEFLVQDWNSSQWQDDSKSLIHYNSYGLDSLVQTYTFILGVWELTSQRQYTYLANELVEVQASSQSYGVWEYDWKYDIDNLTTGPGKSYTLFFWTNGFWDPAFKFDNVLDQVDNLVSEIFYDWNLSSQSWQPTDRDSYTHDNAFPYINLSTHLNEIICRHQLLTYTNEIYDNYSGQYELINAGTYYWSDLTPSSVNNPNTISTLSTYPNPVNDFLHFELENTTDPVEIELYSANGQRILSTQLNNNTLKINNLPTGFYSYLLRQGEETYAGKVIVE